MESPTAAAGERQVTIKLQIYGRNYRTPAMTIEHDFSIPAGSTFAETSVAVPQHCDWTFVSWETWIDGRLDEELCQTRNTFAPIASNSGEVSVVALGLRRGQQELGRVVYRLSNNRTDFVSLQTQEAPRHWKDYSTADLVLIDIASLSALRDEPDAFKALGRWVRAGGNLWVSGIGSRFDNLPELESLLASDSGLSEAHQAQKVTREWAGEYGWFPVSTQDKQRDRIESLLRLRNPPEWDFTANKDSATNSWPYFVAKSYGTGVVAAFCDLQQGYLGALQSRIQSTLSGSGPVQQPNWVRSDDLAQLASNSMLADRLYWEDRHGNDPDQGNIDFNNWLIPGYGEAPVFEFQFLITLFVIGIGPVNYYFLNRAKKLPMLLVTVPTSAAAATLLLFAYGIASDGFSTRTRVRSVTWLDQRNGESVTWARRSYYAGLAPGDGIAFDADTVVYPILPYVSRSFLSGAGNRVNSRELLWDGVDQRLTRGWLASRTPTQYLTIRAKPIDESLAISTTEEGADVTNRLGVLVKLLVVQDEQDRLFMLENLGPGETTRAAPADRIGVAMRLREVFSENEPQTPAGAMGREVGQQPYSRLHLGRSILETELSAVIAPNARDYGGGTYIAITEAAVADDPGVEVARDEGSFHVVRGTWQ